LKFCFLRKGGGRFRRWNSPTATAARGRHGAAGDGAGLARGWLGVGSSWHGEQALTRHARQVICIELQHKLTGWICKALTYKFSSLDSKLSTRNSMWMHWHDWSLVWIPWWSVQCNCVQVICSCILLSWLTWNLQALKYFETQVTIMFRETEIPIGFTWHVGDCNDCF
jgi:hypothetical protein